MKKTLTLILGALLLSANAFAQVDTIPEKVYLHRSGEHQTKIYPGRHLNRIGIIHRSGLSASRAAYTDSLRFELTDGLMDSYLVRKVDSITFYAPDSLMRANLAYQDKRYSTYYPTYADNYVSLAGWSNRTSWQLANVHDPTVMKAADGYYYMSQTDASYGNAHSGKGHFYVRRSKDLINWEPASSYNNSMAMQEAGPTGLLDSVNAQRARRGVPELEELGSLGYWAPCMRMVNDTLYRMYYSVVVPNCIATGSTDFDGSWGEMSWIGLLETNDPASGKWTDKGGVISGSSDQGKDDYARSSESDYNAYARWNAIDPSYIITPEGEHWLVYGSWHCGIAAIQLDPETGKTLEPLGDPWDIGTGQTSTYGKLIATRNKSSRWQGSEGPEVVYNPETGYYYLFLAYDGLDVPYNTRVVRSKSIDGPYVGKNGTNVTTNGGDAFPVVTHPYKFDSSNDVDGWVGISHCAVWSDNYGNWFFASQGRKPENYLDNAYSNALMMGHVRRIYWTSDGWPVVSPERYGGVEQAPIAASDLAGTWELIDLAYSYGTQKTSTELTMTQSTLAANRLVLSGAIKGNATFDAEANTLEIRPTGGTKFTVAVARELDWEASPRQSTIVFCGYPSATSTYWAKRCQDE